MATVECSADLYEQYRKGDRLPLTAGAVRDFYLPDVELKKPAVVQVQNLKCEKENTLNCCARAKISDGFFYSNSAFFSDILTSKFERDNIIGKSDDSNTGGEIILIKKIRKQGNLTAQGLVPVIIEEYELLSRGHELVNNGKQNKILDLNTAEQFRDFIPSAEITVAWLKAQSKDGAKQSDMKGARAPPPSGKQNAAQSNITPIKMITPYVNKWRICGRCTNKEELRDIKTRNGEMKVFNFDLTDKDGDCIRLAGFGDSAVRAYNVIQNDCCYYISGGTVKQANRTFNATGHDYELTLRNDTEITPCHDTFQLPPFSLKACPLDRLAQHKDQIIDILAVVDKMEGLNDFVSRAGKNMTKREVNLIDTTGTIVQLVLWGEQARNMDENASGQVIGIKGCVVKEWNGSISLSTVGGSKIELSPNLPGVQNLYGWHQCERPKIEAKTLTSNSSGSDSFSRDFKLIGAACALQLGNEPDQPNGRYISMKAMVTNTRAENAIYIACPNEGCQKKVIQLDAQYRCEKCNTTSDNYKWNYMASMEVTDCTGSIWVTLFGKSAEKVLGRTANELGELKEGDTDAYNAVFEQIRFKYYNWRIRAKPETYNDETKMRYNAVDVTDVNYDKYIAELKKGIEALEAI
ncbi:unnamed protein product [Auanema sp. JU1783]|nr:unnamed protein product [Auanema sp. JU1783]